MQVSCIRDVDQFASLKQDWDTAYAADSHATVFVSWPWLRGWIETVPNDWLALALRPDSTSPYVAFLMLRVDAQRRRLYVGGSPLADYTGFVCLPEHAGEAVATFAGFIQQELSWDSFRMTDVFDPRLDSFLNCFSPRGFDVQKTTGVSCPYILLPNTWNQYLQDFLGARTRKSLCRSIRKMEGLDGFRVTQPQADDIEYHIEVFLRLFQMRQRGKSESALGRFRVILRHCFEGGKLYLSLLWNAATPVAVDVGFLDRQKRVFYDYNGGWNEQFAEFSPGNVAIAYSIRYAIENGFEVYDLTRGSESYKFSFGTLERFNTDAFIVRKSLRLTLRRLRKRLVRR